MSDAASTTIQTTMAPTASKSYASSTISFITPPVVETGNSQAQTVSATSSGLPQSQPTTTSAQAINTLDNASASASSSLVSSRPALVEIPAQNTYQFAAVTKASTTSGAPRPSSTVNYPIAQNGNAAMASGFNQIYKTMSETSSCDASNTNQAFSCISGELAQCQNDGTYVLKSCPMGQSCYALPLPSGQPGISVECAVPSDAASRLAAQPSAPSAAVSAATKAASTVQSPATHSSENVQGGLVVGGFNGRTTTNVQQQAQTAASSPPAESSSNSQSTSLTPLTSVTMPPARGADQTLATLAQLQTTTPTTPASQAANAGTLDRSSPSQAATEASVTPSSLLVNTKPTAQSPTSYLTEASTTTGASQASKAKPNDEHSASKISTALSGPLFSVLSPDSPSSAPARQAEHQAQSTVSSSSIPTPQSSAIAQELPAAAKDIPETTPTKNAQPAGITIVPLNPNTQQNNINNGPGGKSSPGSNNPGGNFINEKVAISSAGNNPIYITVTTTVTTTAFQAVATA